MNISICWFFRYSKPNNDVTVYSYNNGDVNSDKNLDEDFDFETDTRQTIGRCRCLESHVPSDESHLKVERGEELVVIQKDFGSGWTYVQGLNGVGFVPTKILYFV